jgi:hypothetical protein
MLDAILAQSLSAVSSYDLILITGDFVAHNQVNDSTARYAFEQAYDQ